jgi:hypothetical protein
MEAGIDLCAIPAAFGNTCVFFVDETDPRWPKVKQAFGPGDIEQIYTKFSPSEFSAAQYLTTEPTRVWEYPKPDDSFEYHYITYDDSAYCRECGTGLVQKAPFRIVGEPKWGKSPFFRLHWEVDEIFCTPEAWRLVFEPLGIGCRHVVRNRGGATLQTVVQLDIQERVELKTPPDLPHMVCSKCGLKRYTPIDRGPHPVPATKPKGHIFKSEQNYGLGHSGWRSIMIDQRLYAAIVESGLKGLDYYVCSPDHLAQRVRF